MLNRVMIVDDDALMRTTLHTLIDWTKSGFEIVCNAANGEQALTYLKENEVDLILTDMKMPIMDGIAFMEELNVIGKVPKVIALSGYDEFDMVRKAFRLGALDYVLKSDISSQMLQQLLWKVQPPDIQDEETVLEEAPRILLKNMAIGKLDLRDDFFKEDYVLVQFEIDDFKQNTARFYSNYEKLLMEPMLDIAGQINRVASKCILTALSPALYLMYMPIAKGSKDSYIENVLSVCQQLKKVWYHYMNLQISAGISFIASGKEEFYSGLKESGDQLKIRYLVGKAAICYFGEKGKIAITEVVSAKEKYKSILKALQCGDNLEVEEEKKLFIRGLYEEKLEQAQLECLYLICLIGELLKEKEDDIWSLFLGDVDYYEKVRRLEDIRSLELWMNNYISWVLDYIVNNYDRKQMDLLQKAKRFMMDNYSNPELTLGSVADFVGLNEKYLSTRFTKEVGNTFSNYLTEIRMQKARELLGTTDQKMYEVSESVGYNNVEHFTRMFKKIYDTSPLAYKKQILTKHQDF